MQRTDEEILLEICIGRITFLNFAQKKILRKNIDSPHNLSLLSIKDIENLVNKKISSKVVWNGSENLKLSRIAFDYCKKLNIYVLVHDDIKYPELLRQISDPPYLLFCRGNLEALTKGKSVSVVGTRHISPEGKNAAKAFCYAAAVDGCNVISGLANGVDGYAHQGVIDAYFDALEKGIPAEGFGKTVAVLPCAIDEITPAGHKKMAQQIIQSGGLLISEYEPKLGMASWHFVGRNRIIAGLSPATVVIEAPAGSGALITADFAIENNRDVMFHKATFGELAAKIAETVTDQLEKDLAAGKVRKYKLENRPQKFLEAGAPVIENYNDYCKCLKEIPGTRSNQPIQESLFKDEDLI